ncbi:hypothetical protein [Dethiobacter alkaliphilus]|uniref:hypothetical protein n=1 Tax=Dethiobacter alkaliphilus TaxID=427926 RepID=UPI002225B94D|nr:hypothetical protein [Dethiobacter alkaliphilus]MCW3489728.1 hypothetical protein [Dethiobacter alkaliphilus]
MKQSNVGTGIVFGAGIGIIGGVLFSLNLALTIVIGAGLGLIAGSLTKTKAK